MSVERVTRNTRTALQDLESLEAQVRQALQSGSRDAAAIDALKRQLRQATQELQSLLNRAVQEAGTDTELRGQVQRALRQARTLNQTLESLTQELAKAHGGERNRIGVDTTAARRTAALETAGVEDTRVVRPGLTDAEAREVATRRDARPFPGPRPDRPLPTADDIDVMFADFGFGGDATDFENYRPRFLPVRLAELTPQPRATGTWRGPSATELRHMTGVHAGLIAGDVDSPNEGMNPRLPANTPAPRAPAERPVLGRTARDAAPGRPFDPTGRDATPPQRGPTGRDAAAPARPGGPGTLPGTPGGPLPGRVAMPSFRMGQGGGVASNGGGGLELPMDLQSAAMGDFYNTWTDGMLQLWIMRFINEEQKARGQRKELRNAYDELQLLNAQANIARAERVAARGVRQALASAVRSALKLRDAYYTGEVRKLIESDPEKARESLQTLRETTRSAMGILVRDNPDAARLDAGLGGAENLPGPHVLTPRELERLRASGEEGTRIANDYVREFARWQRHSGVAGRIALYEAELQQRLIGAHLADSSTGGAGTPQDPMRAVLDAVRTADREQSDGGTLAMVRRIRNGEPLGDLSGFSDDFATDLRQLEQLRQEAKNEFNRSMRELGNSPFARAALNDLRGELNQSMIEAYGDPPGAEGEQSRRAELQHLQYMGLLQRQVQLFDHGMMTHGPRTVEDGQPVEEIALRGVADDAAQIARALNGETVMVQGENGPQRQDPSAIQSRILGATAENNFAGVNGANELAIAQTVQAILSGDEHIRNEVALSLGLDSSHDPRFTTELVRHAAASHARQIAQNVALGTRSSAEGPYPAEVSGLPEVQDPIGRTIFEAMGSQSAGTAIQETRREHLQDLQADARREQFFDLYDDFHNQAMARLDQAHNRIAGSLQRGTRMDQMGAANKIASLTQAMGSALAQLMMYQQRARMVQTV